VAGSLIAGEHTRLITLGLRYISPLLILKIKHVALSTLHHTVITMLYKSVIRHGFYELFRTWFQEKTGGNKIRETLHWKLERANARVASRP
jgi:hypothetical protein